MANKSNPKQITLHFIGDNIRILEQFKKRAAESFRPLEQEILYSLYKTLSDKDTHVINDTVEEVKSQEQSN